jgi:hypothetical protein
MTREGDVSLTNPLLFLYQLPSTRSENNKPDYRISHFMIETPITPCHMLE